jgi:hypothetical protein
VILFHSERLGMDLHGGKTDAKPYRVGVSYSRDIRPALAKAGLIPTIPELFGHGHDLPQGKWMMLGNGPEGADPQEGSLPEEWKAAKGGGGNCTIADAIHTFFEAILNAGGEIPPDVNWLQLAVEAYMARTKAANGTAYNPITGEGDTGLDIQAVVEWLITDGLIINGVAHKILQDPLTIEPGNVQHILEAAFFYEKVKMGWALCEAQQQQFDASPQPTWDYVPGSPEIGGHDAPIWGVKGLGSWSEDVYWTDRFVEHQNDEAIAVLHPEQFKNNGEDYEGYQEGDIEKLSVEIASRKLAVLRGTTPPPRRGVLPSSRASRPEGHMSDRQLLELLPTIDRKVTHMEDVLAGIAADEATLAAIVPQLVARDEATSKKLAEFEAKAAAGEVVPLSEIEPLKSGFDQSIASLKALLPAEPAPTPEPTPAPAEPTKTVYTYTAAEGITPSTSFSESGFETPAVPAAPAVPANPETGAPETPEVPAVPSELLLYCSLDTNPGETNGATVPGYKVYTGPTQPVTAA